MKRLAGHAVIDGARAALRLPGTGLDAGCPVAFTGYSEGGHGAAAAAERHPGYAPELNLVGVACGGQPADLLATARQVEGGLLFVCVAFAVAALKAAYPELPLDALNQRGLTAVDEAPKLSIEAGVIRYAYLTVRDLTGGTIDDFFLGQEQWRARVDEQHLGRLTPAAPVFLYHGRFDPFNPLSTAMRLRDDWRAGGADVTFKTYRAEHIAPVVLALPAVHRFLANRFADAKPVHVEPVHVEPGRLAAVAGA